MGLGAQQGEPAILWAGRWHSNAWRMDSPVHSDFMPGQCHTLAWPEPGSTHTRTHLLSGGTLHRNPAAFSSHLEEGRQQGKERVTDWEVKGGGQEEGCVDTFKKPRDQFVDDVLEGFVRSGKETYRGVSATIASHLLSLDSGPSTGVLVDLVLTQSSISQLDTTRREGGREPSAPPPPATLAIGIRRTEGQKGANPENHRGRKGSARPT